MAVEVDRLRLSETGAGVPRGLLRVSGDRSENQNRRGRTRHGCNNRLCAPTGIGNKLEHIRSTV